MNEDEEQERSQDEIMASRLNSIDSINNEDVIGSDDNVNSEDDMGEDLDSVRISTKYITVLYLTCMLVCLLLYNTVCCK